jgi:serine/threonine-protein kinase
VEPGRWKRITELFHEAADLDPGVRQDFLNRVCKGDEELRREVESLLADDGPFPKEKAEPKADDLLADIVDRALVEEKTPRFISGCILAHYEILEPLGSGGMGEVYLAEDMQLRRRVALKLLGQKFTRDGNQVRRFRQEAHSASALNHPNIITIFEIGEVEGLHFIATEYVEGQTLQQLIDGGPMNIQNAVDIAVQIGSALVAAHRAGIVHRDIKPANVMLRPDGYVKVLDFGLAKLVTSDAKQVHTQTGWVVGTPRYMSPEQFLGQELDGRTDTFSFGLVLYELIAGCGPFDSCAPAELTTVGGNAEAPPLRSCIPEAPAELERILARALAKDRQKRYQSADDLLNDLKKLQLELQLAAREDAEFTPLATPDARVAPVRRRSFPALFVAALVVLVLLLAAGAVWLGGGRNAGSATVTPSIAVLPFANMSSDKSFEYVSDGLADELINTLAKVSGLRVAGRTSSFQFKGKSEDLPAIGKKLNVATILEGSVRMQGHRARITVQMIKSTDGFQLWSETFDRDLNDILAVQEEIARAVTRELKVKLLQDGAAAVPVKAPNPEAYNAYLQGRYFLRRNKQSLETAISYFEQAIRVDSRYAPPWEGMAQARISQAESGYIAVDDGFRLAREAVEHALELDPDLAPAHIAMGILKMRRDWDWAAARESFERALAKAPGHARATRGAGTLAGILGRWDDAVGFYRKAVEIDPLHADSYHNLGVMLHSAGRQEEAKAALLKALEFAPNMAAVHWLLCRVYLAQSRHQQALLEAEKEPGPAFRLHAFALAYHALGRRNESDRNLAELIAKFQADAPYNIAEVYAFRGETDRAFAWLGRAYSLRDPGLTEIKGDPLLKSLESDARHAAMLTKMRLPI